MFRPAGTSYPTTGAVNQYNDVDVDLPDSETRPTQTFQIPERLPRAAYSPSVVAYVAVGHAVRGRFDVERTLSLGVPKGPLWAKLGRGETVTTPEGKEITPDMCMGPSRLPTVCQTFFDEN